MRIAVLSGKGGTGKTLISVNLAAAAGVGTYVDCDVEGPNGHLYFKPENSLNEPVSRSLPRVDPVLCKGCRACVDFCRFHALAFAGSKLFVFDEVCHSCGGCAMVCPEKAIKKENMPIGEMRIGISEKVSVISGFLNIGEASGIPIIKRILDATIGSEGDTFIDCPPGSACTVMESIKEADYCVLAAEPSVFGAHNLRMVHELVQVFDKPFGVVLNKCGEGANPSEEYCMYKGIRILCRIPYDPDLGRIHSEARIAVRDNENYRVLFTDLLKTIRREACHEAASDFKR